MVHLKDVIRKQANFVHIISEKEGLFIPFLWFNWLWCFFRYGATPSDWYCYEMYRYRHNQLCKVITRRKNIELDKLFNPVEFKQDFDNKVRFNEIYCNFVRRNWIFVRNSQISEDQLSKLGGGEIVIKPINLSSGQGIFTFNVEHESFQSLKARISNGNYLLEEKVKLCPELEILNPPSCNTIRVYSMICNNGEAKILDAVLRVGGGNTIQDNFHAKGIVYPIDINTGRIKGAGKDLMNNEYLIHPSTGIYMPGYQIPQWDSVLHFAKDAALLNKKARFIGWDIALTANGCEMIEGNYYVYCGFMQIFDKEGKYKLIKAFR